MHRLIAALTLAVLATEASAQSTTTFYNSSGQSIGGATKGGLCGIFTFDKDNQLAGEKIYYDRGTVFHEPQSLRGRITTVLTHPSPSRVSARGKSSGSGVRPNVTV